MVLDRIKKKIEETYGLPKFESISELAVGESGKRINILLGRLERLSRDRQGLEMALELLKQVERMNETGSLERLIELSRDLVSLTKGKKAGKFLDRLEKLEKIVDTILKE